MAFLDCFASGFSAISFLSARVGTIPSTANDHFYHQLKQHKGLFIEEVYHTEFEYGLVLFWQAQDTIHLQKYQFKPLLYKEQLLPSEQLRINKELLTNWLAEKDSLLKSLGSLKRYWHSYRLK